MKIKNPLLFERKRAFTFTGSGFAGELMAATGTCDFLFSAAALHPQKHLAVRAFKILIFFPVFAAADKLLRFGFPAGSEFDIFPVFSGPGFPVPGKHAEQGDYIEHETQQGQETEPGEGTCQRKEKSGQERKDTEMIGAVTAFHKSNETGFDILPHGGWCLLQGNNK